MNLEDFWSEKSSISMSFQGQVKVKKITLIFNEILLYHQGHFKVNVKVSHVLRTSSLKVKIAVLGRGVVKKVIEVTLWEHFLLSFFLALLSSFNKP